MTRWGRSSRASSTSAFDVVGRHGHAVGDVGNARIARRYDDFGDPGALFQPPGQGVFPAAAANDENFHINRPAGLIGGLCCTPD